MTSTGSQRRRPSLNAVRAENCRRNLAVFVKHGWSVLEPETPLVWGWHIDAICKHLEAVSRGDIKRLLINVPPGHMKSLIVGVFWPAWVWLTNPSWRVMFGSYALDLSQRDSVRCRDVISSSWYAETFDPQWKLKGDQNVKTWFENTERGLRMALSVGGAGTGFRADCIAFDDPHNVKERPSEAELENVDFWWHKRMSSRLNDPRTGARVGIMQRVHSRDLSGRIIERGGYAHLRLPTLYRPEQKCATPIGWEDPRTEHDELLFPEMYGPEQVAEAKRDLGSASFAGQHQQGPTPESGGMLKKHWFRFWYPRGASAPPPMRTQDEEGRTVECVQVEFPEQVDRKITSWDMSFKGKQTSDFVAGQPWAQVLADMYLLDQIHGRIDFARTLKQVVKLANAHPDAVAHIVEDAANGPAVISALTHNVAAMLPVSPQGGKEARCAAASPTIEAGNVYLPHPALFPWVHAFIEEVTLFPFGENDDQLDAMTQAINWLRSTNSPEDWSLV